MNNKEELEKYKKELADLEAKQQQPKESNKPIRNGSEKENDALDEMEDGYFQRPHMQNLYRIIMRLFVAVFGLMLLQAFIPIPFIALLFNPASYNFPLPYNGIDFKKISYINNQFIMYGVDYDEPKEPKLVIFNSVDGKKWTKSTIVNNDTDVNVLNQSFIPRGTFAYFNGNCYLFGVSPKPLIAKGNCSEWQGYDNNLMRNKYFRVRSIAIVQNKIYITTENGLYYSSDGINWQQESIPCIEIEGKCRQMDNVGGILFGNGELILMGSHEGGKAYIYSKDVNTGRWKYQFNPGVGYIIRGKDRFVGVTDTMGWVYTDSKQVWESSPLRYEPQFLSYGVGEQYVGLSELLFIEKSQDGKYWRHIPAEKNDSSDIKYITDLACNQKQCYGAGKNYYLVNSHDGEAWIEQEFNLKNPRLAWYRRFFN